MRVAVCFTGHMRKYHVTSESWKTNVLERLNADLFIHSWKGTGNWIPKPMSGKGDLKDPGTVDVNSGMVDESDVNRIFSPTKAVFEDYYDVEDHFVELAKPAVVWRDTGPPHFHWFKPIQYISQLYKFHKALELKQQYERDNGFKYDVVIRSRSDLLLTGPLPDIIFNEPNRVYVQIRNNPKYPEWINDILLAGSSEFIDHLGTIYPQYSKKLQSAIDKDVRRNRFFEMHELLWDHFYENNVPVMEIPMPFGIGNSSLVR